VPGKKKDHATDETLLAARKELAKWIADELGISDVPALAEALTHASYAHEHGGGGDYQRLEFLGDAVLQLCASELLFARHPEADEGALTRIRRDMVSAGALARFAAVHRFGEAVALGRGKRQEGVNEKILANVAESVLAAIYLAGGLEAARRYTDAVAATAFADGSAVGERDPKEALQEWSQRAKKGLPEYLVVAIDEAGNPTETRVRGYRATVSLAGEALGNGEGATKQRAERAAATIALERVPRTGLSERPPAT